MTDTPLPPAGPTELAVRGIPSTGVPMSRIGDRIGMNVVRAQTDQNSENDNFLTDLVAKLRLANAHLVIATMKAQDLQAAAEATSAKQEEFLGMLAHELRNPLAPVVAAAELLGSMITAHPLLPKIHKVVMRQTNHMTRLVDDLLDASRINSGKITLSKNVLPLVEIIESAIETSQPFIDKRRQHVVVQNEDESILVDGDLVRLAQVFSNLLINAAKFAPEHTRITVTACMVDGVAQVSVKDQGIGIALEAQPFIFDLFTQGPQPLDRALGGLGIGLSLARTVVELHNGSITVHSDGAGAGSEFIVLLPIARALVNTPSLNQAPHTPLQRNKRVLLIDDNADTLDLMSELLSIAGYAVHSAGDSASALALVRDNTYDVIICDLGLPGMDGFEVARQLRQPDMGSGAYLIAYTGYDRQEDRVLATEAGFDHFLVKPVTSTHLIEIISALKLH